MRSSTIPALAIVAAVVVFSGLILHIAPEIVSAQSTCPPGTSPATAADVPLLTIAGIPTAQVGMCCDSSSASVGQAAGSAKQWLAQHATKGANIACLNSTFAERLENLMQAVPGGSPVITDGYRSPQAQANLPAASTRVGPCGSYHQYGMAADFNTTNAATLKWMRENASQFGLSPVTNANPVTGCTLHGFCDGGHIQIAGPKPPLNQCGICATSGGNGSLPAVPVPTTPDDISNTSSCYASLNPIIYYPAGTVEQSQCMTASQPQQQQPQLPPQPTTATAPATTQTASQAPPPIGTINNTPYTAGTCSPQTYCLAGNIYYRSTQCVDQIYQSCQYGCSAVTCNASSSSQSLSLQSLTGTPFSGTGAQNINPTAGTGTSAFDFIEAFANPAATGVEIGTTTPVALNANTTNTSDVVALQGTSPSVQIIYASTSTVTQPMSAQQTFTSSNLADNPISYSGLQQNSFLLSVLGTMKTALLDALVYLKYLNPFSGTAASQ